MYRLIDKNYIAVISGYELMIIVSNMYYCKEITKKLVNFLTKCQNTKSWTKFMFPYFIIPRVDNLLLIN